MHPPRPHSNLAARMGRWSAAHWKTATFGWLAFVVVAFALGGVVGTKNIDPNAPGPGESGRMDRILDAGFKQPAGESVLIQSRSLACGDSRLHGRGRGRRRARLDAWRPSRTSARRSIAATPARSRRTGTPRSSSSRSAATRTRRSTRSTRSSTASPTRSRRIRASSSASSATRAPQKGVETAYGDDLGKAGVLSLPITLIILVVAFGALVAAGIPLLLALTAVFATFGLVALPSHLLPVALEAPAMVLLIGLAVGVDYSMFYLKREREERAAGRSERAALEAAAATSGRSVLDLRPDGDGGDGRHVPDRRRDVRLARRRDDPRRRRRGARLADRAARAALEARRQGRPAARPARRPAPPRRRRGPDLGRDRRPRPAPARALGGRLRRRCCWRSPLPALQLRLAPPGPETFPQSLDGRSRRTTGCSRRSPARRCRPTSSSRRRTCNAPAVRAAIARARAAGARERPRVRADHGRRQRGRHGREHHRPDRGERNRRRLERRLRARCARRSSPRRSAPLPDAEAGVTGRTAAVEGRRPTS